VEIHQFLVGFSFGDAITNYALEFRRVISEMGFTSYVYAERVDRFMSKLRSNKVRRYTEHFSLAPRKSIVMLHFSIGSKVNEYVKFLHAKKVLIYHNITPASFFNGFGEHIVRQLENGRRELISYADVPDVSIGVSEYNCRELRRYGFKNVKMLYPPAFYLSRFSRALDKGILSRYRDGKINILFVGRVVPNKRVEDLIKTLYVCKTKLGIDARLIVVGSYEVWDRYYSFLMNLVRNLNLEGNVVFTDKVKNHELVSYYKVADVFLSMSEHEGFCVPLVEAMMFSVPVVAYTGAAVPYTVGDAGLLFYEKDFYMVAETVCEVAHSTPLRRALIEAGRERVKQFSKNKWDEDAKRTVESVISA